MALNVSEKTELLNKISELQQKQMELQREIYSLQFQIRNFPVEQPVNTISDETEKVKLTTQDKATTAQFVPKKDFTASISERIWEKSGINAGLEKFVGENLISKIGIIVLIIGVAIGVKYAIDNNLISPLMRIILGYLVGFCLSFFAFRLKDKMLSFSAVLTSGSLAVYYFITYAAHSFYNLFPQIAGIIIMVIITVLTVLLALYYSKQVIAHFGLVGAYIIPYLLDEPFKNPAVLFSYMAIINSGIVFLATRKQWKPLNYVALIVTWIIFGSWFFSPQYNQQLSACFIFLTVFFTIFHLVLLSYKLILRELFNIEDIFFLIINAGVFYLIGYNALNNSEGSETFLGLFTFINAVVYCISALLVHRYNSSEAVFKKWNIAIAIGFVTLAVAVQLENYETAIIWALEATALFWFGRSNKDLFFEIISYFVIIALFFITTANLTSINYNLGKDEIEQTFTPILNFQFLATFITVCSLSFILFISFFPGSKLLNNEYTPDVFKVLFPAATLIILYFTFYNEISIFWNNKQVESCYTLNNEGVWMKTKGSLSQNYLCFKNIWLFNYTLVFSVFIAFVNFRWMQKQNVSVFSLIFQFIIIFVFLAFTIHWLNKLLGAHLNPDVINLLPTNAFYVIIRYFEYLLFIALFISIYKWVLPLLKNNIVSKTFDIIIFLSVMRILSSELLNWLKVSGSDDANKYILSILWGVLSLLLIIYGIWKKQKHMRITAISIFGVTLLKLFFYDLTNLETIPKTLVFILTGGLLLIVSYLYNKYTKMIFEEK